MGSLIPILAVLCIVNTAFAALNVQQFEIKDKAKEFDEDVRLFKNIFSGFDSSKIKHVLKQKQDTKKVTLQGFSWHDCSSASSITKIKSLSVGPDPLTFPGPLNVSAEFIISKALADPLKASLKIEKKEPLVGWIKIPCIDNFGSCEYDKLCEALAQVEDQCPEQLRQMKLCSCPIPAKDYVVPPKTSFNIMASIIPSGDYRVTANVSMGTVQTACLEITLSVL